MKRNPPGRSAFVTLMIVIVASSAAAQTYEGQRPYEPPIIQFGEEGIGLLEAVRLTLEHDPNIKLQQADTALREGALQERIGIFDISLLTEASYEYQELELPDTLQEFERQRRQNLQAGIEDAEQFEQQTLEQIAALDSAIDNDQTIGNFMLPGDPILEAQIRFIDTLILQRQAAGASAQDLIDLRNDIIRERLVELRDLPAQVLSELEQGRQALQDLGPAPDDEVLQTGHFRFGVAKLLRNGLQISPFLEGTWDSNKYKGKPTDLRFGGKGIENLFTVRVGFNVVVPLARGAGSDSVAAAERAARFDLEASRYALEHQSAVSALETVLAYWDLKAAQERVEVARRSVELQERLVQTTQELIQAGELPGAELSRVQASYANSQARLEDSRLSLHRARVRLAEAMGIEVNEETATLPGARDAFPGLPDQLLDEQAIAALTRSAVDLRRDLKAALSLEESGRLLVRGARLDIRPKIDVKASSWYMALAEGSISDAVERWVGPSVNFGIDLEQPFGNNARLGRLAQTDADLRQRSIDAIDLERLIKLGIVREALSLQDAVESVRRARESVQYYQQTIEAEIELLRIGRSTLVDSIVTEQQQTNALLDLVSAENELARILAILRFESGTLVSYDPEQSTVTEETLTTVPGGKR